MLALTHPSMLSSAKPNTSTPGTFKLSRLNGWPMCSPTDASPTSSRMPAHGSGPMWFATPSSQWTCTTYSLPVSRRTPKKTVQLARPADGRGPGRDRLMDAVDYLDPLVGVVQGCTALGVNRARVYRVRARRCHLAGAFIGRGPRARPPLALSVVEQEALLQMLNSDRFADMAPASIHATLLDEGCGRRFELAV